MNYFKSFYSKSRIRIVGGVKMKAPNISMRFTAYNDYASDMSRAVC